MKRLMTITVAAFALAALTGTASADLSQSYNFAAITANDVADVAVGQSQLSVLVSEVAGQPHQALFTFLNVGSAACSITDVYFQDGTLLAMSDPINGPGVQFTRDATPQNLPGGNAVNFTPTQSFFSADSDSPVQPNGVNPGESLGIRFDLQSQLTYADVISALDLGIATGGPIPGETLRIGIHVQGFATGQSESFITGNPPAVPAPASIALVPIGLGLIGLLKRKFA
jgi:hypothetical protein